MSGYPTGRGGYEGAYRSTQETLRSQHGEMVLGSHKSRVELGSYMLRAESEILRDRDYSLGLRSGTKAGQYDILRQSWRQAPMLDVCELLPTQRLTLTSH